MTDRCRGEPSVACVVLDVATGEVLALISSPSFDPIVFSRRLSPAAARQLAADPRHPLIDKTIAGVYPPGSTFKPVVALSALAASVITARTTFFCPYI